MSGAARLAAFGVALAAVFLAAAAVGRGVGPLDREVDAAHAEEETTRPAPARELSVELVQGPALRYRVVAPGGRAVTQYDVLHARPMHLIVVRRDLAHFQHLHPQRASGDTWFVPYATPAPGTYTAFADFSTGGERYTLQFDLNAGSPHGRTFDPRPRPRASRLAQAGPYRVDLGGDVQAGTLSFDVTRAGRPVRVQPYLGARGHLVALRERDLRYLHVHAEEDELAFEAEFPSGGWYRLYLQFRAGGAVRTAEFAVRVRP